MSGTLGRSRQTSQNSWRARRLSVSGSTVAPAPGRSALVAPVAAFGPPLVRSALVNPQDSTPKWSHFVKSLTTRGKIKRYKVFVWLTLPLRCNFPFSSLAKFNVAIDGDKNVCNAKKMRKAKLLVANKAMQEFSFFAQTRQPQFFEKRKRYPFSFFLQKYLFPHSTVSV